MDLVTSIADMSVAMHAAQTQQSVQTTLLKKSMDTSTQLAENLLASFDSMPKFAGDNGMFLDVRA